MSIKNWLASERPREKLLEKGAKNLSDAELLALLLGSGSREQDVLSLSRDLLSKLGGIRQLAVASQREVCAVSGLGPAKFASLQAAFELSRRAYFAELAGRPQLGGAPQTKQFLIAELGQCQHERFVGLFLDSQHQLLAFEELARGDQHGAQVLVGEVAKVALSRHASALIVAHNHPAGSLTPSQEDLGLTKKLSKSLALLDIQLLDHILVAKNRALSFAERGFL